MAIARALANDPAVIVADETTGNWIRAPPMPCSLCSIAWHDEGKTFLMVTHDRDLAGAHRAR